MPLASHNFRHSLQTSRRPRGARSTEMWHRLNRLLTFLVLAGFVVVLALWFYPEIKRLDAMNADLKKKEADLASEQLLRRQREREKSLLENDPEYIEALARDRLDLMKDGETIFRLDAGPIAGQSVSTGDATAPPRR